MRLLPGQDLQQLLREFKGVLETHLFSGLNPYQMRQDVRSWRRQKYESEALK